MQFFVKKEIFQTKHIVEEDFIDYSLFILVQNSMSKVQDTSVQEEEQIIELQVFRLFCRPFHLFPPYLGC